MRSKLFAAAVSIAAVCVGSSGPVAAQRNASWSGVYAGINVGYGWHDSTATLSANDPSSLLTATTFAPQGPSLSNSGAMGGLQLGYNWRAGRDWVMGAETDFQFSRIKGSDSANSALVFAGISTVTAVEENVKWFGTLRGRLGYLPTDNLLIFATGGLAYGRVERQAEFNNTSGVGAIINTGGFSAICVAFSRCFAGSQSRNALGWTAGGGVEYAFTPRMTFKAEYLLVSLGDEDFNITAQNFTAGVTPATFAANFDRTMFSVARVGLNYRF